MDKQIIPEENIEIYCYLYCIETALRELIIALLQLIDGPRWYKKRLPTDVKEKYLEGLKYERKINWIQLVPHHPIYYIDFPFLKKIIERQDNWDDAFKNVFLRKDILSSTLSEIEFIRNKIAHNRKATYKDLEIIKGAFIKLSQSIGEKRFNELVRKCTCAADILERITELQNEFKRSFNICKNCKPLEELMVWKKICKEWWFDGPYLGHELDGIINYFSAIEEYAKLPRIRGSGHIIESWLKTNNIETKYLQAEKEFLIILSIGE